MGINSIKPNNYWVLTKNHWTPFNPKKKPNFNPTLPKTLKKKTLKRFSFLHFLGLQTLLTLTCSLSLSLSHTQRTMRHNKHSTETIESRFLGTISAFSIRNDHDTMEGRAAEENKGRENGAGGYGVECPLHRSHLPSADLDCPTPISPTHFADLACPAPISLLPYIFFLSFADLT